MAASNSETQSQSNSYSELNPEEATVEAFLEEVQDWSPPRPRNEHLPELMADALVESLETETLYQCVYESGDSETVREVISFPEAPRGAPVLLRFFSEYTTEAGESKERLHYWVGPKGEATLDLLYAVVNARTTADHAISIEQLDGEIIDDLAQTMPPIWSDAVKELMADAAP